MVGGTACVEMQRLVRSFAYDGVAGYHRIDDDNLVVLHAACAVGWKYVEHWLGPSASEAAGSGMARDASS